MNIAGVVIFYNPSQKNIANVLTTCKIVQRVVVVDNSAESSEEYFYGVPGVTYLFLGKNSGIGCALNLGIKILLEENYQWYLTLDQDTVLPDNYIDTFHRLYSKLKNEKIGIISPIHLKNSLIIESDVGKNNILEVEAVMMSGNILNKYAYIECGKFQEDLFIDYVDIEYCLRLNSLNYKVFICRDLAVDHELGDSKWHKFMGITLKPTYHNHVRRYYITRNRIAVFFKFRGKYNKFFIIDLARFFKEIVFIIVFEEDKIRKIIYVFKGIKDGLNGRLGEIK